MDYTRPGKAHGPPSRRVSRPLSQVPASERNLRQMRGAPGSSTKKIVRGGEARLSHHDPFVQGVDHNGPSPFMRVSEQNRRHARAAPWSSTKKSAHRGETGSSYNGPFVQGVDENGSNPFMRMSALALENGRNSNPRPRHPSQPMHAGNSATRRGMLSVPGRGESRMPGQAPALGSSRAGGRPMATPSFLPQQAARSSSSVPPRSRTATAVPPRQSSSRPPTTVQHPFKQESLKHRPSRRPRPVKQSPKPSSSSASRFKQEPGTSWRVAAVPTISQPSSTTAAVKNEPHTLSTQPAGRVRMMSASQEVQVRRLLGLNATSSVPSTAGDRSTPGPDPDHGSPSEQQMDALALSSSESRPNAWAEIQRLLKMPDIDIPPEDRASTPVQMSITLMEHQKIALKWLKDQESNPDKKGGLLADTMGLGKTIEALALIVANKPPAFGPKTTLIVAPLALLRQWKREIEDKIKPAHRLTVFIYHGREKRTKAADRLYDYDVVLTTYETIAYEYNSKGPDGRRRSLLFTHPRPFYRIILDEAHKIKNRNTGCSKAVVDLRAEFRLCMTGTPFMNNTGEIFSLVRFLRIAPYCDWKHFSHDIETPLHKWAEDAKGPPMRRLQALFRSITLRRTKDSVLDGKPILTLPKLTVTPTSVELDKDQRDYYLAIEKKHQLLVNKYLKHNKLHKVITYIMVLLTRLRQVCDHPFLIKNHGIPDEATLNSKQMVQLSMRFTPKVVSEVMRKKKFQCPLCDEPVEIPIIIFPCGHDMCPECFSSMMQVGIQATRNAENSQLGLAGFIGGDADMETKCPQDDCQSDILPNKIVCHDHFLDAHSLGGASQVQEQDCSDDESDDCCSSNDEEDNSENDDGDLADFIVTDGEDESEADSDESESDERTEGASRSKLQISAGLSAPVDQVQTPDTLVSDCEGDELVGAVQDKDRGAPSAEVEEENMASIEDVASQASQNVESTPDSFVIEDMELQQSPGDQPTPPGAGSMDSTLDGAVPTLGNDVWGHALSRLREGELEQSDADSGSDLESLSEMIAKVKAKPAAAAAASSSRRVTGTGKRISKSSQMLVSKKRPRRWDESEEEERPRKVRKGRKAKKKNKKNKKGKGKSLAELKKAGSTSKAGKLKYFNRLRRDWESSAKVDVTIDLLLKIRSERPTEKTLVFSLWTSFLDLLEIPMQDEKLSYLRYDGGMTFNERDDNVKTFSEDPRENILLVSLMAGNAGLNLTAASQVIILEPFWNPFVEDQAIDRAHRIGQDKEVQVHRLLVPDSVEDRILALQEKKRKLVNTALSEEGAQGVGRLSIGELRGLFGLR